MILRQPRDVVIQRMQASGGEDPGAVARRLQPLHRVGATRDIANTAVYLASERAAQVTGSLIPVDGGTSTGPPPIDWDDIKAGS